MKVTKDLIRQRAIVAKATAYFKKARKAGWHVAITEVMRELNAKPPWTHLHPDIALIHEAAKACGMSSSCSKSILVFHPSKSRPKGRVRNKA
jgi:hypothetical protein